MPPLKVAGTAVAILTLVAGLAFFVVRQLEVPTAIAASSSATGHGPDSLLDQKASGRTWETDEGIGAWLLVTWERPVDVNRIGLHGATGASTVLATFDDGSTVHIAFDAGGEAAVSLPHRRTAAVRITFATLRDGAERVGLSSVVIDDEGIDVPDSPGSATPTASSSSAFTLTDGDVQHQDLGDQWVAEQDDLEPWVQLSWSGPRAVSAVQLFGPEDDAVDPEATGGPRLAGTLQFSDGSEIVVSGIGGGNAAPTTIGFPARVVDSVRLQLIQTVPDSSTGLREFVAYGPAQTPSAWSPHSVTYATDPVAASDCTDPRNDDNASTGPGLRLLCPAPGSVVNTTATIAVADEPNTEVVATGRRPAGGTSIDLGTATTDHDGRALLSIDTTQLAAGPVSIQVAPVGGLAKDQLPLTVQLLNRSGIRITDDGHAPPGSTLQWGAEFDEAVSVSGTGRTTTYAAAKPAAFGTAEFGDAVFADPSIGADSLTVVDDDYLRLRLQPVAGFDVATPYGQRSIGALLSSVAVGASGFSAQYGYFEARMTGAPGLGTWPAFWMLNTQSATSDSETSGEVDAVELYGHEPTMTCHTLHDWGNTAAPNDQTTDPTCLHNTEVTDWTSTWHTYGAQITPDGAVFYIDGVEVRRDTGLQRSPEPFFFLVDLALGSGWPIDLSPTAGISDLYVDWIRVHT